MLVSDLGDHQDGVQTGVLGQGGGDDLEGLGEMLNNDGLDSGKLVSLLSQLGGDLNLGGSTSRKDASVLNQTSHNAESVMDRTVSLVDNETVGTSNQQRKSSDTLGDSSDLEDTGTVTEGLLVDETGSSELLGGELVDVGDRGAADGLKG